MLLEDYSIRDELKLLHYRLLEAKGNPVDRLMLPSHSFMRPCNACGVNYASEEKTYEGEDEKFYCNGCLEKRKEEREGIDAHLWRRIIKSLRDVKYVFPDNSAVERDSGIKIDPRPNDFNEFSLFSKGKDYMGLIYAGLMNVARSTTYGELERFIRHQRERDWQPSKRDIKTLYTELEKWLIAVKTRRIRTEFHLLSDKFTSSELDELMAKLAYDFLRHLVAENMLIAAQRESERRGRRK